MNQRHNRSNKRVPFVWGSAALLVVLGVVLAYHAMDRNQEPAVREPSATVDAAELPLKSVSVSDGRIIAQSERTAQRTLSAKNAQGRAALPSSLPSLAEALSSESALESKFRIAAVQDKFYDEQPLNAEEVAFLYDFLRSRGEPANLSDSGRHALKNEVMNLLSLRLEDQDTFLALLQEIHQDTTRDPVMRDYALQFMAGINESSEGSVSGGLDAQWSAIRRVTGPDRVSPDDAMLASTSLLHVLSAYRRQQLTTQEQEDLKQSALRIASREDIADDARSTALQVCGQLQMPEAGTLAAEIARSNRNAFALRIAAIATLGQTSHSKETVEFLEGLTSGPNARLRLPAQAALNSIYASL